jgi:formylglycine-generating enzyme required for sulfatase activity
MAVQGAAAPHALEDPRGARAAGRELLSLALMDGRNALLARLAQAEAAAGLLGRAAGRAVGSGAVGPADTLAAARGVAAWWHDVLRLALLAGAWQERWISRHPQRTRGEAADPHGPLLAGIEPALEHWLDPAAPPPDVAGVRAYLAATLELTLELLERAAETDTGLYFYRLALLHEDRLAEALAERLDAEAPASRVEREPIWLPAQRWMLGSTPGAGLVPHNERWAHEVSLPEFEIDAQPVNWRQFVEFAEDGGYDRRECWSEAGWAWLQAADPGSRRAPRGVEQLVGGVVRERGGALQRVPLAQPVLHVTRHEAEAWCRWAGRRLPSEPEWELAAATAASRGFVWGDVFEWVTGSARAYPDCGPPGAGCLDPIPREGTMGTLRGASFATRKRWHHPKARRFAPPHADAPFCGFRSCAL